MVARSPALDRQIEWLRAGVRGVVDETDSDPAQLRKAICKVLDGEVWAPRRLLSHIITGSRLKQADAGVAVLTPRENEVAELMREGLKNAAIASRLHITEKTVKGHLTNVFRKIGVENRTQAVVQLGQRRSSRESSKESHRVFGSK